MRSAIGPRRGCAAARGLQSPTPEPHSRDSLVAPSCATGCIRRPTGALTSGRRHRLDKTSPSPAPLSRVTAPRAPGPSANDLRVNVRLHWRAAVTTRRTRACVPRRRFEELPRRCRDAYELPSLIAGAHERPSRRGRPRVPPHCDVARSNHASAPTQALESRCRKRDARDRGPSLRPRRRRRSPPSRRRTASAFPTPRATHLRRSRPSRGSCGTGPSRRRHARRPVVHRRSAPLGSSDPRHRRRDRP